MGKDLKGRDLGVGIYQRQDGLYSARYTNKLGKRKEKYFKKLQECRQWIADARFVDSHSELSAGEDMTVEKSFWIPLTVRAIIISLHFYCRQGYALGK